MVVKDFIQGFVKGTLGKKTVEGGWQVEKACSIDRLVFWGILEGRNWRESKHYEKEHVAYKLLDGTVIYNSNVLEVARAKAYGRVLSLGSDKQTDAQIWLRDAGASPLPFSLFDEIGLSPIEFRWIVKPVPEYVERKRFRYGWNPATSRHEEMPYISNEHFTGASVFAIGEHYYLFDIDRKEIAVSKLFNAFVVELPGPATTIEEAYDLLMPDRVREATAAGAEIERQGEFYFIKVSDEQPYKPVLTAEESEMIRYPPSRAGFLGLRVNFGWWDHEDHQAYSHPSTPTEEAFNVAALRYKAIYDRIEKLLPVRSSLIADGSGRHKAEHCIEHDGTAYVSGKIEHTGREHGTLSLQGWWMVVPNRAIQSVTIRGEID